VGLRARPVPDPGFGDTIDFPQIKEHYYVVHKDINPTQVIPAVRTPPAG
jgi:glutathionyl-hydroquinone reductase